MSKQQKKRTRIFWATFHSWVFRICLGTQEGGQPTPLFAEFAANSKGGMHVKLILLTPVHGLIFGVHPLFCRTQLRVR